VAAMLDQLAGSAALAALGPHTAELRRELHRQRAELSAALHRLQQAADLLPPVDDTRWQGPARTAYDSALARLRAQLARATTHVRDARDHASFALTMLDG
jgi:hypothetical protein